MYVYIMDDGTEKVREIKEFFMNAPHVEEDGTADRLYALLVEHGQRDSETIHYACDVISKFIEFSMDISTSYRSEKDNKYKQEPTEEDEYLNYDEWKIEIYDRNSSSMVNITPTKIPDIDYPELDLMLKIFLFCERDYNMLSEEEKELRDKYGSNYSFLFAYMLNGNKF